jgi:hypothetical protein
MWPSSRAKLGAAGVLYTAVIYGNKMSREKAVCFAFMDTIRLPGKLHGIFLHVLGSREKK